MPITRHECSDRCDGMPHRIRPVSQAVRDATAQAQESKLPTPPAVRYVKPGETVTLELPWSEVCMSMRVAGRTAQVRLEPVDDRDNCVAQIFDAEGRPFSFPVLPGEAGIMRNTDGWYYYPPVRWTCAVCGNASTEDSRRCAQCWTDRP